MLPIKYVHMVSIDYDVGHYHTICPTQPCMCTAACHNDVCPKFQKTHCLEIYPVTPLVTNNKINKYIKRKRGNIFIIYVEQNKPYVCAVSLVVQYRSHNPRVGSSKPICGDNFYFILFLF